ncbi:hypothetical protein B0H14DRAFT_2662734 [Mycena olivaceomarginata]|nr:hypothetical protein B0H14DRAFT_2662734 [Mycena olivaceomarginata]
MDLEKIMQKSPADHPPLVSVATDAQCEPPRPTTGGKTVWNTTPQDDESDLPLTQDTDFNEDQEELPDEQPDVPINTYSKSEWDDTDESEDEDVIDAPSTNIRDDFERVLNGPLDFKGSYYFHKSYNEFPNPVLRLGSLGHIGLPLSSREAKHVISHCIQAPFGQGERTLVDKNVRDTWEMDASQVHFDNPAWKPFMHQVSREVCLRLGLAASQASTVRCEPYKLLLYETGSHTEKAKGMFATIVVVLPSLFQGGAAHLSHGDLSTTIDSSPQSLTNVSVLAWYTDVVHEIKPITGGYRLAIAFNLIQTANSRPKLPETSDFLTKLRHVLLSWKQRPASTAKQLNFDVGLANVECHLVGYGDGGYGSEDDDDVGMAEVEERNMSIENLVDLDGGHIQDEVECKEDDSEFCPQNLRAKIEAGEPDEREYEGYQGNGAGSLELWYRRTVLVIWPHRHNAEMEYGADPKNALVVLASTYDDDDERRLLVRFLLRGIASRKFGDGIAHDLCKIATQWKNLGLWLKTLEVCDPNRVLNILSARRIVDAIEVFGFEKPIQDVLAKILAESPSNAARIKLLDSIMARAETERRQRYQAMKTLRKPIIGEEELLVKLTVEGGGIPFSILPQVISTADADFYVAFSTRLVIEQSLLQTQENISLIKTIVRDLLTLAIQKTDFFSPPSPALAYSFIEACVMCSHGDLLVVSDVSSATALMRTSNILVPLVSQLRASHRRIPGLGNLCRVTVDNYIKHAGGRTPADAELSAILDAVVGAEDSSLLPKLVDQLLLLPFDLALCRTLITNLRSRAGSLVFDNEGGLSSLCAKATNSLVQRTQYNSNLPLILSHFQLCLSTDNIPTLSQLFPRLFEILLPLVPKIQVELASRNISPSSPPFGAAFKQIFELYASKVLGPKTADRSSLVEGVKRWTSCCNDCTTLTKFFLESQESTGQALPIGMPQRKHLEQKFCFIHR